MRNASEQPRIRIVKRDGMKKRYLILLYAGSVLLALGIGAIFAALPEGRSRRIL